MKISEVLEQARNTIEENGWGQNQDYETDSNGQKSNFCMTGAVNDIVNYDDYKVYYPSTWYLARAISPEKSHIEFPGVWIIRYNDEDGRTKEEVLNVFNRAIVLAQTEEGAADAPNDP